MAHIISYGQYNMPRLNSEMRNRLAVNSAELRWTPFLFLGERKNFEACHIEKDNTYLTIKVHVMIK